MGLPPVYQLKSLWVFSGARQCVSWFLDHIMKDMESESDGRLVTKLEEWQAKEKSKLARLRKERHKLEIKLKKNMEECERIRLKLEHTKREQCRSEGSSKVASMFLLSWYFNSGP